MPSYSAPAMLVTVIIPVFNGRAYLAEALTSVVAQNVAELEIVTVDDGSTDGTGNVVRGFADSRLRYVRQSRMGASAARDRGVALARGHFLAFLDADDVWLANKLRAQITSLTSGDADMIFTHMEEFISPDCLRELEGIFSVRPRLAGLSVSTLLVRRSDFQKAGGYDTGFRMGEFIDWYARAIDRGLRPATLPEILVRRRLHNTNMTRVDRNQASHYALTMKKILDRRRAGIARS